MAINHSVDSHFHFSGALQLDRYGSYDSTSCFAASLPERMQSGTPMPR